ncbi:exportin-2-like isoform X2 [Amphibalanus amphitrite]|uniref:exportin-2-like isoform X2 n=1 Tax=Amphibalanus amphitrite TaxID=1232801 RepID=UPI001C9124FF|nr:exportin-2-like isoform X2 [Amphibalanus amphitrite]
MELNEQNLQQLATYLGQTLSPDPAIRRPAEKFLESIERNENYSLLLLNLLDNNAVELPYRISAAITFKNFVKRNWKPDEDGNSHVSEKDRAAVRQLSDAISVIGRCDFPARWPNLIGDLTARFSSGDFHVINGILRTAHSLFERYRYEFKSNELWTEIKFVLDNFAKPLTELFVATMALAEQHATNAAALKVIVSSLVLICELFYSLNYQDLPEYFEDNMETWMPRFLQLLELDNKLLQTEDEEEAGPLEQLRTQICDNVALYAQKYDEEFGPYLPRFVQSVWKLLASTGMQVKYDLLVSNAIQFLSCVVERPHYKGIFEGDGVLSQICEKIIVPNMEFRVSDEELFEDNPQEYIRRDVEGSDVDTRRRAACDLVKSLSRLFEQRITQEFSQYVQVMLAKAAENRTANWKHKDAAIYLVTSLAAKGSTQKHGVTQTSSLVNLDDFYQAQILPELQDQQLTQSLVLKADAIKYVMAFRSQLRPDLVRASLPYLAGLLRSPSVVVHSYAAMAIEKLLMVRAADKTPLLQSQHVAPLAKELLTNLVFVFSQPASQENEYAMKAVMRTCSALQEAAIPHLGELLPTLTTILAQVSKNPSKPHFNHYLFETLALSIRVVCKSQPAAVATFEGVLFPHFQTILQQDVQEFVPYVFQLLSVMLELQTAVPEPYQALLPHILAPVLWEKTGNVPPLVRFIAGCVRRDPQAIIRIDKLPALLGVFQKLIASRANDHHGFTIVSALFESLPEAAMEQYTRQLFQLMFQRLTSSKTVKFVKSLLVFFFLFAHLRGGQKLIDVIDNIQAKMFGMVVERLVVTEAQKISGTQDKLICTAGMVNLLCDTPALLDGPYSQYWAPILQALIGLFELPEAEDGVEDAHFVDVDESQGYQAAFSQLLFAPPPIHDPLKGAVSSPREHLVRGLQRVAQQRPGRVPALLASGLAPEAAAFVQKYVQATGVILQ